ncbi:MAG: DNA mismatch repair endonuclease MutL [Puniceicoccales bacterium]|nr:DNA mismatch repair endonuclease MutL [Puniceicoccales bacterium]
MGFAVQLLPEVVVNQVAAGEVVERPSAVVKELVENAIDGGATRIGVDFRRAGKDFISVRDDGVGMGREDALLAVQRHATSKIRAIGDLQSLHTFGFRGEALPSIAAVSHFVLRTRRSQDPVGTEIPIVDGVGRAVRECAMEPGTEVRVSHLFQSVPARRKFLRTDQTEASHIVNTMRLFAIAFPAVQFQLCHGGRMHLSLAAAATPEARLEDLLGRPLFSLLLPVAAESGGKKLFGHVLRPDRRAPPGEEMVFFVNRRPIGSRELRSWVLEAYGSHFPGARSLPCFLFLELPPDQVDVNVHPTKREVRFSRRGELRDFLLRSLADQLAKAVQPMRPAEGFSPIPSPAPIPPSTSDLPPIPVFSPLSPLIPVSSPTSVPPAIPIPIQDQPGPAPATAGTDEEWREDPGAGRDGVGGRGCFSEKFSQPACPRAFDRFAGSSALVRPDAIPRTVPIFSSSRGLINWRFVGRLDGNCAIWATDTGVVFFDIRAAAMRVAYEKLLRDGDSPPRQRLLLPIRLDLRRQEEAGDRLRELAGAGFTLAASGEGDCYRVTEIPGWLPERSAEAFLYDWLVLRRKTAFQLRMEHFARTAASHIAASSSYETLADLTSLLRDLMSCRIPTTAPDGSGIYFELARSEMQRRWAPPEEYGQDP